MRIYDIGGRPGEAPTVHHKVLTAANAITLVRLAGLPLFVWLVLGADRRMAAFIVLVLIAATDWVDGYVARRFDQVTRLGQIMDPLVDRALLAVVGVTLGVAGIMPWWLFAVGVSRDVLLAVGALALFGGMPDIPVTRLGKTATAALLVGFPGLLLGATEWGQQFPVTPAAYALSIAGLVGYWATGAQYALAAWRLRRGRDASSMRY